VVEKRVVGYVGESLSIADQVEGGGVLAFCCAGCCLHNGKKRSLVGFLECLAGLCSLDPFRTILLNPFAVVLCLLPDDAAFPLDFVEGGEILFIIHFPVFSPFFPEWFIYRHDLS